MNRLERAAELVEEMREVLAAAGLDDVTVTANPVEIPGALPNGPVVAVQPPKLTFITYNTQEAEWELFVIAGPPADRLTAWTSIDQVIEALRVPMDIDKADPANYEHPSMQPHAAYVLTFTEQHDS
ncbi:hypothetical protein ACFY5D_18110 [Paeniglutamicibacter sp. NPDC012692]|uniref:hypothetical protein n=1 Tax=Paeniglutamicibacter sp. NPDC012692 TaxID=3364388 RepID=UPI00367DA2FB